MPWYVYKIFSVIADQTIIKAASDYFKKMYYTLLVDTSITEKKNLQKFSSYILVGCTIDIYETAFLVGTTPVSCHLLVKKNDCLKKHFQR